jgi:alpha(1,3/1,4) fucosyltransferase
MEKVVYFINKPETSDSLFYDAKSYRNQIGKPYVYLREKIEQAGYRFKITHDASNLCDVAAIISFCYVDQTVLHNISHHPLKKLILLALEPPSLLPFLYHPGMKNHFGTIFTMLDDWVDGRVYYKFYHPIPLEEPLENVPDFDQKKLCVMILSNMTNHHPLDIYAERRKVASFFENDAEFDLYGSNWDHYPTWKGNESGHQFPILKNYRFCFAYENTRDLQGYITERIFNAFFCGCVPIYWGAANITDYVPAECFIDRRQFSSHEELYRFIKNIDRPTYESYIDAAQRYIKSPQAHLFSPAHFAHTIMDRLNQVIET